MTSTAQVCKTESLTLFTLMLRLSYLTFTSMRVHLKFQLERFLDLLIKRVGNAHYSPEHVETALDVVYQVRQLHGLATNAFTSDQPLIVMGAERGGGTTNFCASQNLTVKQTIFSDVHARDEGGGGGLFVVMCVA